VVAKISQVVNQGHITPLILIIIDCILHVKIAHHQRFNQIGVLVTQHVHHAAEHVEILRNELQLVLIVPIAYAQSVLVGHTRLKLRVQTVLQPVRHRKKKPNHVLQVRIVHAQSVLAEHITAMALRVQTVLQPVLHRKKKPKHVLQVRIVHAQSVLAGHIRAMALHVQTVLQPARHRKKKPKHVLQV